MKLIKLLLIAIATLLLTSCAISQLVVVTPETQTITVSWTHDGLDTLGNPDRVVLYNIFLQRNNELIVYIGSTPIDTVNFNPPMEYTLTLPDKVSKFVIGMSAVDIVGNEGDIHLSTDSTAGFNGWYLLFDIVPPSKGRGLVRIK